MISRFFSRDLVRLFSYVVMAGLLVLSYVSGAFGQNQTGRTFTREDFTNVDGASLSEKLSNAERQFKSAKQGDSYWIAYHFQARDGMNIGPFSGYTYEDSDGIRLYHKENPDGVAVFFLMDASGSKTELTRIKTLNLNEGYLFEFKFDQSRRHLAFSDDKLKAGIDDNDYKFDTGNSTSLIAGRNFGVVTDIVTGPDGGLYVTSLSNGTIYLVR